MNAPEKITEANQAHDTLAHYDEAMSADQIAYELAGRIKPMKAHTKEAVKQLKQLANLGMIEMEPRAGGVPFYRLIAAPANNINDIPEVGDMNVVESVESDSEMAVIPPPADPALLASANRMPSDRLEGVAHALRGCGLPALAEISEAEA